MTWVANPSRRKKLASRIRALRRRISEAMAEVAMLRQSDEERFSILPKPGPADAYQITVAVPIDGLCELVTVPVQQSDRRDPRTIKIGPVPEKAKHDICIVKMACEWMLARSWAEKFAPECIVE